MDQNFYDGFYGGIDPNTICTVTKHNVVDRDNFNWWTKRYYEEFCKFVSENPFTPFTDKLKLLLQNGLTPEQIQNYFNKNINTMDKEQISFITKAISRTTMYQKKLKAKENNEFTNGKKQYQYIKNQPNN